MKNKKINLHMERKRALVIMLFFALLFSMIGILAAVIIKTDCAQLSSLLRSKYIYSATVASPVFEDDYYQFDAGISYMLSEDDQTTINAEILMQSENASYTDLVNWNIDELDVYEVAVTEGLAKKNGVRIGDKLYSKHIVDGMVYEYTVEQILPELITARVTKHREYTCGIIIMGYDSQYIDNISHRSIVFTRESIDELASRVSGTPESIVYRSDEVTALMMKLFPYFLLFAFLAVIIAAMLTFIFTKAVQYNFKRLKILGFEKKELDSAYNRLVYSSGLLSIIISAVIVSVFSQLWVFSYVETAILFILTLIELATLFVSTRLSKRQLWR